MSITTEISRIQTDRDAIRAKLVELGMATNTSNLTALASAIENLINRGAVSVTVKEGETYTIPAGYHNGSGTVSGVAGGGNYSLQSKTVAPTKKQQNVTPDSGYYGLSDVTVSAIPDAYQNVSSVTAAATDVLTGKVYVASDGTVVTGTMVNNGAVSKTLDVTTVSYTIPKGYHSGTGTVKLVVETKTVTPTKATQTIKPTSGKVLSQVTVDPIPDAFQDVTDVTATADDVLVGKAIVASNGTVVEGAMPNNEAETVILYYVSSSVFTNTYTIPKGYHDGTGKVLMMLESKTVTPSKVQQKILPSAKKTLSYVKVEPIPDNYIDTTDADAVAGNILDGKFAYVGGVKIEGSMPNNGSATKTIDGLTSTSVTIPAGYTSGGTVSLTSDIETALAAI